MSEKFQWEEFDKLHVIRRLRQLVGKWWDIQINFTDEKGFVRGVPQGKFFNPIHRVCKFITHDNKGFKGCMGSVRQTTVDSSSSKKAVLGNCHAGFSTLTVPIRVGEKYLGCVFGDGFLVLETENEQKAKIRSYLEIQLGDEKEIIEYIEKLPVLSSKDIVYLTELIEMVVEEILITQSDLSSAKKEVDQLKTTLGSRYGFSNMVGKSTLMQELYGMVEKICNSNALVLIRGENGTGKELIAKALHFNSKRKKNKFLVVNCGAFNDNLLESEFFGHCKGAFTGAVKDKEGLFESAKNGTIFLDEIGDTSLVMQVKLLRILQEGTFTPVGSTEVKKTNARVVCATNKNLEEMVKKGEFREDLYYRLNVINLNLPSLKERKEDLPLLIESFLKKYADTGQSPLKAIEKNCMSKLLDYNWPGNVRELENEIERLCVLAGEDQTIDDSFLSTRIKESMGSKFPGYRVQGRLKDALEALERKLILEGLKRTRWNKSRLAKELGISRAGLIMKVEKYELDKRSTS